MISRDTITNSHGLVCSWCNNAELVKTPLGATYFRLRLALNADAFDRSYDLQSFDFIVLKLVKKRIIESYVSRKYVAVRIKP